MHSAPVARPRTLRQFSGGSTHWANPQSSLAKLHSRRWPPRRDLRMASRAGSAPGGGLRWLVLAAVLALLLASAANPALAGDDGADDDDGDDGTGKEDDDGGSAPGHDNGAWAEAGSRASSRTKRKQLMIVALSGTREKDEPLRRGMIEGWANNDTWLVTQAETSWPRVIRLPDEAEEGGYDGVMRKSLLYLFPKMAEEFGDQYDFFLKTDPDTYINMDNLKRMLSLLDPSVPAVMGTLMGYDFGDEQIDPNTNIPEDLATLTRKGTKQKKIYLHYRKAETDFVMSENGPKSLKAAKNEYIRLKMTARHFWSSPKVFCHGHAYIITRPMLKYIVKHLATCMPQFPTPDDGLPGGWEDVKLGACMASILGAQCVDMGYPAGFDRLGNEQDFDKSMSKIVKRTKEDPFWLAEGTTFHKCDRDVQLKLRSLYDKQRQDRAFQLQVAARLQHTTEQMRDVFTARWNCTLGPPFLDGPDNVIRSRHPLAIPAMCQQSMLKNPPAQVMLDPSLSFFASSYWNPTAEVDLSDLTIEQKSRKANPGPLTCVQRVRGLPPSVTSQRNLVLVFWDENQHSEDSLVAFLASLRATGCTAEVVVFVHGETAPVATLYHQAKRFAPAKVFASHWAQLNEHAYLEHSLMNLRYGVWASYLDKHQHQYHTSMHCSLDTRFQSDPFLSINTRGGLALFMEDPWVVRELMLKRLMKKSLKKIKIGKDACPTTVHRAVRTLHWPFGQVVDNPDVDAKSSEKDIQSIPALGYAIGSVPQHRNYLTYVLNRIRLLRKRSERLEEAGSDSAVKAHQWPCVERQMVGLAAWNGYLASKVSPLTLYLESDSMVALNPGDSVNLYRTAQLDAQGCAVNAQGHRVAVLYQPDELQNMW